MSIIYCEKHDRRWDSDRLEDCPLCEFYETQPVGLRKPWAWVQPRTREELIQRLLEAREYAVPERERENLCSVAYETLRASPPEAEERDAARYRWLRNDWTDDSRTLTDLYRGELLDKFVDAARSRS